MMTQAHPFPWLFFFDFFVVFLRFRCLLRSSLSFVSVPENWSLFSFSLSNPVVEAAGALEMAKLVSQHAEEDADGREKTLILTGTVLLKLGILRLVSDHPTRKRLPTILLCCARKSG